MEKVSKKAKRRFGFLLICVFGIFAYFIVSLTRYWVKILENNAESKKLAIQYQQLLDDEKSLKSEVSKLQDPEYIARYASEKFLYSKDGMTIIRIIDDN